MRVRENDSPPVSAAIGSKLSRGPAEFRLLPRMLAASRPLGYDGIYSYLGHAVPVRRDEPPSFLLAQASRPTMNNASRDPETQPDFAPEVLAKPSAPERLAS